VRLSFDGGLSRVDDSLDAFNRSLKGALD